MRSHCCWQFYDDSGRLDVGIAWIIITLPEEAGFSKSLIRRFYFLDIGEVRWMSAKGTTSVGDEVDEEPIFLFWRVWEPFDDTIPPWSPPWSLIKTDDPWCTRPLYMYSCILAAWGGRWPDNSLISLSIQTRWFQVIWGNYGICTCTPMTESHSFLQFQILYL